MARGERHPSRPVRRHLAAAALWLVRTSGQAALPEGTLSAALGAWSSVYLIMFASLGALVVTGALRLGYRRAALRPGGHMTRIVLIKHAVFVTVFALATVVAIRALQP